MNKTIQRPLACRNAHCGAMCSPADAIFLGNPKECYKYERRDDLYRQAEILDKVKQAREEINSKYDNTVSTFDDYGEGRNDMVCIVIEILDRLISEVEE